MTVVPSFDQVTVAELNGELLQLGPTEESVSRFLKSSNGLILFPNIVIPSELISPDRERKRKEDLKAAASLRINGSHFLKAYPGGESNRSSSLSLLEDWVNLAWKQISEYCALEQSSAINGSLASSSTSNCNDFSFYPKQAKYYDPSAWIGSRIVNNLFSSISSQLGIQIQTTGQINGINLAKHWKREELRLDASGARPVNCISWHPYLQTFSIAHKSNVVLVYDLKALDFVTLPLYHCDQDYVYSMSWRPCAGSTLAVGSKKGVCLWNLKMMVIEPGMERPSATPGSNWMSLLSFPGMKNITSLSWSPCGRYLATGSIFSSLIVVWRISDLKPLPLRLAAIEGNVSALEWSKMGNYLIAGTTRPSIFVWNVNPGNSMAGSSTPLDAWSSKRYECPGILEHAQWTINDKQVILSFASDSRIFVLSLVQNSIVDQMYCLYDLKEKILLDRNGEGVRVGGFIKQMKLDPNGKRLLVSFVESKEKVKESHYGNAEMPVFMGSDGEETKRELIAVFDCHSTLVKLQIFPLGYISGPFEKGERHSSAPVDISFCNSFKPGSLSSIVYANGKITFIPFLTERIK